MDDVRFVSLYSLFVSTFWKSIVESKKKDEHSMAIWAFRLVSSRNVAWPQFSYWQSYRLHRPHTDCQLDLTVSDVSDYWHFCGWENPSRFLFLDWIFLATLGLVQRCCWLMAPIKSTKTTDTILYFSTGFVLAFWRIIIILLTLSSWSLPLPLLSLWPLEAMPGLLSTWRLVSNPNQHPKRFVCRDWQGCTS